MGKFCEMTVTCSGVPLAGTKKIPSSDAAGFTFRSSPLISPGPPDVAIEEIHFDVCDQYLLQADAFARSNEVKILKKFARDIRKKLPIDPIEKLKSALQKAVAHEQYEDAARIRDEIKKKTEEVE